MIYEDVAITQKPEQKVNVAKTTTLFHGTLEIEG